MATTTAKQLTFAYGNNSKIYKIDTDNILKPITTNVPFSDGKILFTLRDSTLNGETKIDKYKGGYIYFDYKLDNDEPLRLAMTSYFSDTAERESSSNIPLREAIHFPTTAQSEGDTVVREDDNNTSIIFQPFGNPEAKKEWVINYYPSDTGWQWNSTVNKVTLQYLLKGVNRTITLPDVPLATQTTTGLVTAADQTFGGNKTFNSDVTTFISERTEMTPKGNDQSSAAGLVCSGSALFLSNMRIDGTWLTINQTAKIECNPEKPCINFVFV